MYYWRDADGSYLTDDAGLYLAGGPVCPCDTICDRCCDPPLASAYTVTLSAAFTLTNSCVDHEFSGSYVCTHLARHPCVWYFEASIGGGYYATVTISFDSTSGVILVQCVVKNSSGYDTETANAVAAFYTTLSPCDPTGTGIPFDGNYDAGVCAPASGGTGVTVEVA